MNENDIRGYYKYLREHKILRTGKGYKDWTIKSMLYQVIDLFKCLYKND